MSNGRHIDIACAAYLVISDIEVIRTAPHVRNIQLGLPGKLAFNANRILVDMWDVVIGVAENDIVAERCGEP